MNATNIKNNKRVAVQHGELALRPIDSLPTGATTKHDTYVAAHSETGHHHIVTAKNGVEVLEADGHRYMLIQEIGKLYHEKTFDIHETQYLAPGAYELTEKTEYDPFAKVIRRVFD